jgi:hypothetical protein
MTEQVTQDPATEIVVTDGVAEVPAGYRPPQPDAQAPAEDTPTPPAPRKDLKITPTKGDERPAWLPTKFKSAEEMAKAYGELETRMGQKPAADPSPGEKPSGESKPAERAKGEQLTPLTPTEFESFGREVITNGKLSDESYQALQKRGLPKQVVDAYLDGQDAIRDRLMGDVLATVGGEEGFQALTGWASKNVSAEELDIYNSEMDSGNPARIKFAVSNMKARHQAATGRPVERPVSRFAGGRPPIGGNVYRSLAEFHRDQRNPAYKTDPVYRQSIIEKLGKSGDIE